MSERESGASALRVVLDDNHLLAVDKPAGMPAVPDASGDASALDVARAWVKERYAKPGAVYLGVVHRLDRPVSGLLLFARTSKAAARLSAAWVAHDLEKTYLAIADGWSLAERGSIEHHLVKDERANRVQWHARAMAGSKVATTRYEVLARTPAGALLALEPVTGRPHQLRAACASAGHPLLGDLKYGARAALADGQIALHAARLALAHPTRAERVELESAPERAAFAAFREPSAAFLARRRGDAR